MKITLLRAATASLLLAVMVACLEAVPAPPHLTELPPFEFSRRDFGELCRFAFSPDGKTLLSIHHKNNIVFWDVATRRYTACIEQAPPMDLMSGPAILSPDGKTLASVCGHTIALWDVASRRQIGTLIEDERICWLAFSPDNKRLTTIIIGTKASISGALRIWDVKNKRRVRICKIELGARPQETLNRGIENPLLIDSNPRPGQPDSTHSFTLFDAITSQSLVTCEWKKEEAPGAHCFALNRACSIIASAGSHSPVQLWNMRSGKRIACSKPHPSIWRVLTFSPDGAILAACYQDDPPSDRGGFILYDTATANILTEVKKPGGVCFSPDGQFLAVGDDDRIKLLRIPEQWRRKGK